MFVLRCAFWLSLVYASMSWNEGRFAALELGAHALAASHEASLSLAHHVASGAASVCADHMATCANDAAKLAALFVATATPDVAQGGDEPRDARLQAGTAKRAHGITHRP